MNSAPGIAILLSTYNGEAFLAAQLDSLLEQSYENYLVVARDDGSSDSSPAILKSYQSRFPDKFHIASASDRNLGARDSFALLLNYVLDQKAELGFENCYLMFCDQDDRWFPDKIEIQMKALLQAEQDSDHQGSPIPILVHSDLRVVSEQEDLIAASLVRYQGLEIERNRFPNLVISNLVTGCTTLFNEALARKAVPIPGDAIMHDWWLALVASAFGRVVFLDQPLIHYRQHDNNTIGAKQFLESAPARMSFWRRILALKPNAHLHEVARQARSFRRHFGAELDGRNRLVLRLSAGMVARVGIVQRVFYRLARRF